MHTRAGVRLALAVTLMSTSAACAANSAATPGVVGARGASYDAMATEKTFENQAKAKFKVLYEFQGGTDGIGPRTGLVELNGVFYGTTQNGGNTTCNCGTVYKVGPAGVEQVVHRFAGGSDGAYPNGLTVIKGQLYGTTIAGGVGSCVMSQRCGTIYRLSPAGAETILYRFAGGADGANPEAGLLAYKGFLYGTTSVGGARELGGTVFSISTAGVMRLLHSFLGKPDGEEPFSSLIRVGSLFYGTTIYGGNREKGVVFSIDPSNGHETVVHSFAGRLDGADPTAPLFDWKGVLYGTTQAGGSPQNYGTIYSIGGGKEHTVYAFKGGADGSRPYAGLALMNDKLYGTTGAYGTTGLGNIYSIDSAGKKTIVHQFTAQAAGSYGELLRAGGAFYGTTVAGGAECAAPPGPTSCGTVFKFTP
jgi:uncharacterized repeat protein (TIGR03803 family)